jgi:ribonuclease R
VRSERNIAHRIIEEFMLAANEAVANFLAARGMAALHRVHELPDPKKVLEFEELARAFGYSLGVADLVERRIPVKHGERRVTRRGRTRAEPLTVLLPADTQINIRPQHYQNLVRKIAGRPEERILSYLMLRSLKQARYAAEPLGHFALACHEYTHFTSPIRRYPDLIVHRLLKWSLAERSGQEVKRSSGRGKDTPIGPYKLTELEEIGAESSEAERRAQDAERELMDWKSAQYMEEHLGDEYEALIISVQKFGFFVELMEVFVEGLVPLAALEEFAGERCFFREQDRTLVSARRRRVFRLGDRLRVRADRIDPMRRRVEFTPVA